MAESRPLWERQTWDSAGSFAAFRRWLLQDKRPRSLDAAYRVHVGRELDAHGRKINASQTWRRWYQARDTANQPIADAVSWEDRAQAYDDYLAELDRQKWERRLQEVREADWQTGEKLREQVDAAIDQVPQFLKTTRRIVRGRDGQPDQVITTLGLRLNEVAGAAETASKLQRDAAEAPTVVRHEMSGPGGGPIVYESNVDPEHYRRAIESLADALREIVSRTGAEGPGAVDAPEPPAVAGIPEPGG